MTSDEDSRGFKKFIPRPPDRGAELALNGHTPVAEGTPMSPSAILAERDVSPRIVHSSRAMPSLDGRVADALAMPLLVLDHDLQVQFINRMFCSVFEVSADEAIGCTLEELGHGQWESADLRDAILQGLRGDIGSDDIEIDCDTLSLGHRVMLITTTVMEGSTDRAGLILVTMSDVTARIARDVSRREFGELIDHEMANALTLVLGKAQVMLRRAEFSAEALTIIVNQASLLARLMSDLRETPRFEVELLRIDRSAMDLIEVARASVDLAQAVSPAHTIRVQSDCERIDGTWDRGRLTQVLTNLLSNAVKYSPAGGEVLLTLEDKGTTIQIDICDHGVGIPVAEIPHNFKQGYRVASSAAQVWGLGLGLFITQLLVQAHGGTIRVDSAPAKGSTFRITLPRDA